MISQAELVKYCVKNEFSKNRIAISKDLKNSEIFDNEIYFEIKNCKIKIIKSAPYVHDARLNFFINFTESVLSHYALDFVNFEAIVNFHDTRSFPKGINESRLSFARDRSSPHICIPDCHIQHTIGLCNSLKNIDTPIENKIDMAIFAGADTGAIHNDSIQRINICKRYKNSKLVKSKITKFIDFPIDKEIYSSHISIEEQLKYKFILNINGNTTSWERLIWAMKSNSICVFVKPPWYQDDVSWYYHFFDVISPYCFVDEFSLDSFVECFKDKLDFLKNLKNTQKNIASILDNIDIHALYYAEALNQYHIHYNEQK